LLISGFWDLLKMAVGKNTQQRLLKIQNRGMKEEKAGSSACGNQTSDIRHQSAISYNVASLIFSSGFKI
jgi:hypothetical protein